MDLTFESVGLQQTIDAIKRLPQRTSAASAYAINRAITVTRADAAQQMQRQLNFPKNYLGNANDPNARLAITEKATADKQEGKISARRRATSLSRFATFGSDGRSVFVAVKGGKTPELLKGAFPIRLRAGTSADGDAFNRGIAYRAKKGEVLTGSRAARQIANGLYLLYGPSVDQAFQTVIPSLTDDAITTLKSEFFRQLDRLGVF